MIKVIALDLVGVLVREKRIEMSSEEDRIERKFGPNISDESFLDETSEIIADRELLIKTTKCIIDKLYEEKDPYLFKKLKAKYNNVKIIIATNHVSYVRKFIEDNIGDKLLDDIIISAEINKIKPNPDFYEYLLDKLDISANEMLFLDDNQDNVNGALALGIHSIKVDRDMVLFDNIIDWFEANKDL